VKRRLLLKALSHLNRYHRRLPVRVQRWLWFIENRYVWDQVEIRLNGVPLKQDAGYPGALSSAPVTSDFSTAFSGSDGTIAFEVRPRDKTAN
jgi:hypothetical protein